MFNDIYKTNQLPSAMALKVNHFFVFFQRSPSVTAFSQSTIIFFFPFDSLVAHLSIFVFTGIYKNLEKSFVSV